MVETKYFLTAEGSSVAPLRYQLSGERVTLGRHGDIVIQDPSVSREHAVLTWAGDFWWVTDAGSRNGTFVNGVCVQRKNLSHGDVIKVGKFKLRFMDSNSAEESDNDETRVLTCAATTFTPSGEGAQSLVGRSEALRNAMRMATKAARSNATVLLYGESGTGKELFARMVWEESGRSKKKFLPVHSGAIEPSLLASTLFGHEKGAFTGADKQHKGLFEEADGGTIFLDEIGEITAETQVKLLRVLQEGEFMRVGGVEPVKVDVRVICATNRDLVAAVREGKFREDLYYRLNVIKIDLPPLRERTGDIVDLVNHYVGLMGGETRVVSQEAMTALCNYRWPGNIRELRNMVERLVVMSENGVIGVDDLPRELLANASSGTDVTTDEGLSGGSLADVEERHLLAVLRECNGNKSLAAEKLGISRSTLYEKLKGLTP